MTSASANIAPHVRVFDVCRLLVFFLHAVTIDGCSVDASSVISQRYIMKKTLSVELSTVCARVRIIFMPRTAWKLRAFRVCVHTLNNGFLA